MEVEDQEGASIEQDRVKRMDALGGLIQDMLHPRHFPDECENGWVPLNTLMEKPTVKQGNFSVADLIAAINKNTSVELGSDMEVGDGKSMLERLRVRSMAFAEGQQKGNTGVEVNADEEAEVTEHAEVAGAAEAGVETDGDGDHTRPNTSGLAGTVGTYTSSKGMELALKPLLAAKSAEKPLVFGFRVTMVGQTKGHHDQMALLQLAHDCDTAGPSVFQLVLPLQPDREPLALAKNLASVLQDPDVLLVSPPPSTHTRSPPHPPQSLLIRR